MPYSFASLASLTLFTAIAVATPAHSAEKPVPPTPVALHAKLEQISRDPASLAAAVQNGEKEGSVCRHCHGAGGNSALAEVPNLAGQNAAYLLEQMNKFVQGQRKSSDFMTGLIKALTPDERIDIALFMSQQPVAHKATGMNAQAVAGRKLYGALCVKCHGPSGTGTYVIPRLAGQQVKYLEDSLKRYRSGVGGRIDPYMAENTRHLGDADIQNLAAFLSVLQP